MTISIDTERGFDRNQYEFMMKTPQKVIIEGRFLSTIKAIYTNPELPSLSTVKN